MPKRTPWTRQELLVAFALYCRLPFGKLHHRNPEIVMLAESIGRTPSALAMKLTNIASLDPAITRTRRTGLRNASANDRAMWEEMQADWGSFAVETHRALEGVQTAPPSTGDPSEDIDSFPAGEDRAVASTARAGHDFFRAAVHSAYDERCCITGLSVPSLLVASHIIPWRTDITNRANPRNGLLLSALHDKAFDGGILTINDDMTVRVSPKYTESEDSYFGSAIARFEGRPIHLPEKFAPAEDFLSYHRQHIFQAR